MKSFVIISLLTSLASLSSAFAIPYRPEWSKSKEQKDAERHEYENSMKYFHEPASHDVGADELLGHYDTRYFKKKLEYDQKRGVQVHMMRAYLESFREKGIETWIAHGTLLGWWWNGLMLPWDWDIDTQVSEATLLYLGEHLNGTLTSYTTTIGDEEVTATYLTDVNRYSTERVNGNGFNIIDARWINIENGMYIDITGLSENDPEKKPGIVSCKNFHNYDLGDIYPLRDTEFEGVKAMVPYAYDKMLVDEYSEQAMVRTEFEGHHWSTLDRQWKKQLLLKEKGEEGS